MRRNTVTVRRFYFQFTEVFKNKFGLCNSVAPDNITATSSFVHFKLVNFMLCEFYFHGKKQEGVYGSVRREDREGINDVIIVLKERTF